MPSFFSYFLYHYSNTLVTWCEVPTHWKRPWCWERLRAGGEGNDRGWDGWMASPTQCTWVWANSGRWTGIPGVLRSMGLERVRHDLAIEQYRSAICLFFQPILHLLSSTHVCILTIRSNYSPSLDVLVSPFKMSQSLAWLLFSLACSHFSKGIFVELLS